MEKEDIGWTDMSETAVYYGIYILLVVVLILLLRHWFTALSRIKALKAESAGQLKQKSETLHTDPHYLLEMVHQLRTPIALLLGPLESLKNAREDERQTLVDITVNNAQRLLTLIEQMQDLAEHQYLHPKMTIAVDVMSVMRYTHRSFEPLFAAVQSKLLLEPAKQPFSPVQLCPDVLEKLLVCLLEAVLKHCSYHQTCILYCAVEDNRLVVMIRQLASDHLNDSLSQVKQSSLVKVLLQYHRGEICRYDNELRMYLSAQTQDAQTSIPAEVNEIYIESQVSAFSLEETAMRALAEQEADMPTQPLDIEQPLVLVVDSNIQMCNTLRAAIEPAYACQTLPTAEQGLEYARQNIPDLIISAIELPQDDGFALTRLLRSEPLTCHIPIILIGDNSTRYNRQQSWQQRADDLMNKPFAMSTLLARIENLLIIRHLLVHRWQQALAEPGMALADKAQDNECGPDPEQLKQMAIKERFLEKLEQVLAEHLGDIRFDVTKLAALMHTSKRQLNRKTKAVLGMTPLETIRHYRLKTAAKMLEAGDSVSNVAYDVGFTSHSYFSACFKARYGCMPSAYQSVTSKDMKN